MTHTAEVGLDKILDQDKNFAAIMNHEKVCKNTVQQTSK